MSMLGPLSPHPCGVISPCNPPFTFSYPPVQLFSLHLFVLSTTNFSAFRMPRITRHLNATHAAPCRRGSTSCPTNNHGLTWPFNPQFGVFCVMAALLSDVTFIPISDSEQAEHPARVLESMGITPDMGIAGDDGSTSLKGGAPSPPQPSFAPSMAAMDAKGLYTTAKRSQPGFVAEGDGNTVNRRILQPLNPRR